MNLFEHFRGAIAEQLATLGRDGKLPAGLDASAIAIEPPRDPSHGDIATNAALVLAKPAKLAPRAIAEPLAQALKSVKDVVAVGVAGPGFINLRLSDDFWRARLKDILTAGADYGTSRLGSGEKVMVEYVSANPTGPMHVGHCRGAVVGDALAALMEKAGFAVTREYYINDAGGQVLELARSVHWRYREALGESLGEMPEGLYPGDYLKPVGEALAKEYGPRYRNADESEWLMPFRDAAVAAMMRLIRDDLAALGIRFDVFFSEQSLHAGKIAEARDWLAARDLIYTGVLEPPKGMLPEDWEPRPQTLFRATQFGDDVDRPLQKSDGTWTYFAADIAYHRDKLQRGFNNLVEVWGADHGGYVKRMAAVVKALSGSAAKFDVKLCQLVKVMRDGQPVRMSKRSGDFVTLREVVDEVGKDVVRFIMLTRKNDAPLDFDFVKVTEQSKDNPVFYVQYAHARIRSVLRTAAAQWPDLGPDLDLASADLGALAEIEELALIKTLAQWPRLVETAAVAHEPHRVAFFLNDLAAAFHVLWSRGNEDPARRFLLADDRRTSTARLALAQGVATVIASGLAVIGVAPAEEMR
jgi:arginyl-tRNA synthetase